MSAPTYLFAVKDKPVLDLFEIPLIKATEESVREYGRLVYSSGRVRNRDRTMASPRVAGCG